MTMRVERPVIGPNPDAGHTQPLPAGWTIIAQWNTHANGEEYTTRQWRAPDGIDYMRTGPSDCRRCACDPHIRHDQCLYWPAHVHGHGSGRDIGHCTARSCY